MSPRRRPGRKLLTALLPTVLIILLALAGVAGWLVRGATRPPRQPYLVTPEKFSQLSDRGLRAADERWPNRDGTEARGWLLRGAEGAPAVILLHAYGADRSWLLNLGVKLNETTNLTVLLPDLRGHGENPPVAATSFGTAEAGDVLAALDYLRSLKGGGGGPLVGGSVGVYGVEQGAYAALLAARSDGSVRALALDSVPGEPDDILRAAVTRTAGFDNIALNLLARAGTRVYFAGEYRNESACTAAEALGDRQVLLLSGPDAGELRHSTETLAKCFPSQNTPTVLTQLPLTGITLASASPEQGESYDRRIIEFFDRTLRKGN